MHWPQWLCTPSFNLVKARAKLGQVLPLAPAVLDDLRVPPGKSLEALKDDRKGQHSVRINAQWRLCFVWAHDGASDVEIVDYH